MGGGAPRPPPLGYVLGVFPGWKSSGQGGSQGGKFRDINIEVFIENTTFNGNLEFSFSVFFFGENAQPQAFACAFSTQQMHPNLIGLNLFEVAPKKV